MNNFQFSIFNFQFKPSRGFAMLFAVLASTLVLSIGISIFNLTIKELTLSSMGRESQFAFFAADSGVECAYYWNFVDVTDPNPTCAGSIITRTATPAPSSSTSAQFTMTFPEGYCAIIKMDRTADSAGVIADKITSRGYNTCDSTDPTRVERALVINY